MVKLGDSKIKSSYIGTAKIKKAYIGEDLVFGETKPSRLPEGYTEVEYIRLSGSCGFNTKYFADPVTTRILMDVKPQVYSGKSEYFFIEQGGDSVTSTTAYYGLWRYSDAIFRIFTGQSSGKYTTLNVGSVSESRIAIDANGPGKTVSIGNFRSVISSVTLKNNGYYLFVGSYSGTMSSLQGDLYSCKVYVSGTIKFDFVPCTNPLGVAGLFDLVSRKFYANSFSGTVSAGPAV